MRVSKRETKKKKKTHIRRGTDRGDHRGGVRQAWCLKKSVSKANNMNKNKPYLLWCRGTRTGGIAGTDTGTQTQMQGGGQGARMHWVVVAEKKSVDTMVHAKVTWPKFNCVQMQSQIFIVHCLRPAPTSPARYLFFLFALFFFPCWHSFPGVTHLPDSRSLCRVAPSPQHLSAPQHSVCKFFFFLLSCLCWPLFPSVVPSPCACHYPSSTSPAAPLRPSTCVSLSFLFFCFTFAYSPPCRILPSVPRPSLHAASLHATSLPSVAMTKAGSFEKIDIIN